MTFVFITLFYHPTQRAKKLQTGGLSTIINQFDPFGLVVFLPMVVCLLLALQWGGSRYPWHDGRIIALLVIFGILVIVFIGIQFWKKDNATVPPRIMKQRSVASGAWFSMCVGSSFFVLVYYLPIWFQAIKGVSAVRSGIMNSTFHDLALLKRFTDRLYFSSYDSIPCSCLYISGVSITALGYYTPFVLAAPVLMSIGAGLLTTFKTTTPHEKWIGYQVIFGLGMGMGMQQTMIMVQTVLPKEDIATRHGTHDVLPNPRRRHLRFYRPEHLHK